MYISTKDKAKEVRKILKSEFPDVKFSVRSDVYSINISYKNAIPQRMVEAKVKQFESISRCEYSGEILSGGNDFVFVNRDITSEKSKEVRDMFNANFPEVQTDKRLGSYDRELMVFGILGTTDFNKPVTVKFNGGSIHDAYVGNLGEAI